MKGRFYGHTGFEKEVEQMTRFFCGTRIFCGSGAVDQIREMGSRRMLVVTDPFFAKNGMAERIAKMAPEGRIFDRVEPDPSVELVAKGTAVVKEFAPDTVVALGGGSAMDCAKAMLYFSDISAKLVAVPTTSGSGSEVTDFAIVTHAGVKQPLIDETLRPWAAVLDDELLRDMPRTLIADAGFDVLCHAVEALGAKNAGAISDALARDAFCTAFSALPESYRGIQAVRLRIHTAATMAGMAFSQAGLGLCHAMSHALGGLYHVPHGRLNAILLPIVVEVNAEAAAQKYAHLARAAGLGGSAETVAVRNLKNALIRLRRQLDMPETLAQAGVEPRRVWQDQDRILAAVLEDPCCLTNPEPLTPDTVRTVLEAVTGRG